VLVPDDSAVGPLVMMAMEIEMLGPSSSIPIDRSQNLFRYAGEIRQLRGGHSWYAGYDVVRRQVNGIESSSHRGVINFSDDFDRDAITNFRMGTASQLSGAIGHISRGFRSWDLGFFAGDDWRASTNLTLTLGLRYEPSPKPYEVNGFNEIPYPCDCNNLAPRLGFAYRLPRLWGRIGRLRTELGRSSR
jgi:outer membrane receptor protein involved in Fe transport